MNDGFENLSFCLRISRIMDLVFKLMMMIGKERIKKDGKKIDGEEDAQMTDLSKKKFYFY